ncbi:alpha/beta hydrolase [Solimonas sp. K1W22B-7]|uniref:alpha/beta hydrolase family protein n=1 Tax=Solimonas sp. K1W22B-7 TaxID=2303331 RepID=UPI000E32DDBD|nr:alpha/beta hydrolase [Solimonas sp. K1W22B-7]AXQ30241.1 alpha/beta hydrolase [Solimonas sp. K1W22B-7]
MRPFRMLLCLLAAFALPATAAPLRLAYGDATQQYGLLHLPAGQGPHPVLVLMHGGCWQHSIAGPEHLEPLAASLGRAGWAVWNIEYRGVNEAGGGWPGTFRDVAAAVDHLRTLAKDRPLDLQRLAFAGHSAGGHLALWAASRPRLPATSALFSQAPLLPQRVLGLAAIADLARYPQDNPACGAAIPQLIGKAALREVSPLQMLPPAASVTLLTGADDLIVPLSQASNYARAATTAGATVQVRSIPGDHFALVAADGAALQAILSALKDVAAR